MAAAATTASVAGAATTRSRAAPATTAATAVRATTPPPVASRRPRSRRCTGRPAAPWWLWQDHGLTAETRGGRGDEDECRRSVGAREELGDRRAGPGPAEAGRGTDPLRRRRAVPLRRAPPPRRHRPPLPLGRRARGRRHRRGGRARREPGEARRPCRVLVHPVLRVLPLVLHRPAEPLRPRRHHPRGLHARRDVPVPQR